MGQKVSPIGLRLGINRTWDSRWYDERGYKNLLHKDIELRAFLEEKLKLASVSRIVIERPAGRVNISVYAARPGVIIGKKGADIEKLRSDLNNLCKTQVTLNIHEVRKADVDARLVADSVAQQLERRVSFRRAMKRAVQNALRMGAEGIRINCAGRLGGAEIARTEWYREGRVPLHTFRAEIDYAHSEALTTYGIIGVKVWICRGEIMEHDSYAMEKRLLQQQR